MAFCVFVFAFCKNGLIMFLKCVTFSDVHLQCDILLVSFPFRDTRVMLKDSLVHFFICLAQLELREIP